MITSMEHGRVESVTGKRASNPMATIRNLQRERPAQDSKICPATARANCEEADGAPQRPEALHDARWVPPLLPNLGFTGVLPL